MAGKSVPSDQSAPSGPEESILTPGTSSTVQFQPFGIRVVDQSTGRGVPLVELTTVHGVRYVTDSAGWIAFFEPELMGQEVFFFVRSHGYEYPNDGFGFAGVRLRVIPGETVTIPIKRKNLAERLYRITGQGIYRDSLLLGQPVPKTYQPLAGGVLGCDSVLTAIFAGKIYWFWGDTQRASYPLGNFWTTGATSLLPGPGGVDPEEGIAFDYFVGEDGFVRGMAPINRAGPVWLNGPVVLRDATGRERMYAHYSVIDPKSSSFQAIERGLAIFDPQDQIFRRLEVFPEEALFPDGAHPIVVSDDTGSFVYFCNPFPLLRVRAQEEFLRDPTAYESFTPLAQESTLKEPRLERNSVGQLVWGWKTATRFLTPSELRRMIGEGQLSPKEAILLLYDVRSGRPVVPHRGSLAWNAYRQAFVMIFTEIGGTSFLGEVWYAEADSLLGPWAYAQKIVTHDRYSFYNPKHHPFFDREGGRWIYFEGTYTAAFSDAPVPTPFYDYNQIMYRLDLNHPDLVIPVPVYLHTGGDGSPRLATRWVLPRVAQANHAPPTYPLGRVRFWAWDRPRENLVPVYATKVPSGKWQLALGNDPPQESAQPVFYVLSTSTPKAGGFGLSAESKDNSEVSAQRNCSGSNVKIPLLRPVLLSEWQLPDGTFVYQLENEEAPPGARKIRDLGFVLPHPYGRIEFRHGQHSNTH